MVTRLVALLVDAIDYLVKFIMSFSSSKKHLYRYFPLDRKYSFSNLEEMILKNNLAYISPGKFNDPFDCKTLFSTKNINDKNFAEFLRLQIKVNLPTLDEKSLDEKVKNWIRSGNHKSEEKLNLLIGEWERALESMVSKLFVVSFCLSERPNNILLWSHYSGGHEGYCVQFEHEVLKNECFNVEYRRDYPTLDEFNHEFKNTETLDRLLLRRKSKHWKYEDEVRMIGEKDEAIGNSYIYRKFPENSIKAIFLGCNISEENKSKILSICKKREKPIEIYQAKKKKDEYGLDFEKL